MYVYSIPLWAQKDGSSISEYEDAFWPKESNEGTSERRFAVADGATETSFSGLWAKQLVRSYCLGQMDNSGELGQVIKDLSQQWWKIVRRKKLPWYAEQKLQSGTFAAFVGVTFERADSTKPDGTWTALACGDCTLVQMREDTLLHSFPIQHSSAFNNSPFLLATAPADLDASVQGIMVDAGAWESGDSFYLMSDALAAWFFRSYEDGESPWRVLRDLDVDLASPFRAWLDNVRASRQMRNDDITLYRVDLE